MNIKDRIKSIKKEEYFSFANLHTHSNFSDGKKSFEELIKEAKTIGLKHFSVCDHNTVEGWKKCDLNDDFLITGVEFDCFYKGTLLHILGYGINPNHPEIERICAKNKRETKYDIARIFKSRHPKTAINAIHNADGIAIFAHPCCCWVLNLDTYIRDLVNLGIDGIETYYPYKRHRGILKFHSKKNVEKLAEKYNLIKTGGTDAHNSIIPD